MTTVDDILAETMDASDPPKLHPNVHIRQIVEKLGELSKSTQTRSVAEKLEIAQCIADDYEKCRISETEARGRLLSILNDPEIQKHT